MKCRLLLQSHSLAGLLTVLHAAFDCKKTLLDKYHYILYFLGLSTSPRFCTTVMVEEENGIKIVPTPINVRVGNAVETVGQAGRPKTITGFQVEPNRMVMFLFRDFDYRLTPHRYC